MVDTPDLKSCELKVRAGSSPASGTEKTLAGNNKRFLFGFLGIIWIILKLKYELPLTARAIAQGQ